MGRQGGEEGRVRENIDTHGQHPAGGIGGPAGGIGGPAGGIGGPPHKLELTCE